MPVDLDEQDAWLQWRRDGITATEVADAWCGTYGGAYSVVASKLSLLPPVEQTPAMDRGQRWQETIADAVHALTKLYVVGEETWCEHVDERRYRATVDGFLAPVPDCGIDEVTAVLEIKTTGVGVRHNLDRTIAQVQWQMLVTGIDQAVIAIATIDDVDDTCTGMRIVRIEADTMVQTQLVDTADTMLAHIDAGTLPPPDTADALETVKAVHMVIDPDPEVVDLAPIADIVAELHETKAQIRAMTARANLLEATVRENVGDQTVGTTDGWRVNISRPSLTLTVEAEAVILEQRPDLGKVVLDRDKAKAEAPELYESHRQPVGARRLTIKQTEGDN
jgi:predicted phage-related endonuclease